MIDGDGCISIATYVQRIVKNGKTYLYDNTQLAISIFQTDERLMKWLMFHYGGRYHERKPIGNRKVGWTWVPPMGKKLEKFLLSMIPYLLLKKEQGLLALDYVRLGYGIPGSRNNGDLQKKRQNLARRCSTLNS